MSRTADEIGDGGPKTVQMAQVGDPNRYRYYSEKLLAQVGEWLHRERFKAAARSRYESERSGRRRRADSVDSQSSALSLDKLQTILDDSLAHLGLTNVPRNTPRVSRLRRRRSSRLASSDTDYVDGDAIVPGCDAWLDNSKTLINYAAAAAEDEREAWLTFKNDIIRIAHTLRLKGWRRVALDAGDSITVERLSGALTNAVYVVTPSPDLSTSTATDARRAPSRVLLRIYGPQVEHLIDRDNELKVLQRLARKKIGPRLLGTFKNGRFEQFFNAITLRPLDLRDPETSRQIAKRMRELHTGIDLLPHERQAGPAVWRNWDQWLDNVTKIMAYLDAHPDMSWTRADGYVCGVPWTQFLDAVARYRAHVISLYQSPGAIGERLVFAHNDTQYGNILRLRPDDEKSPLLQAANKHKQLVVIDFEYAAANVAGLEFANHFTEWTYNYHDAVASHACCVDRYPSVDEQRRFIKAYVDHRPQFPSADTSSNPSSPLDAASPPVLPSQSSSSVVDFVLDARAPPGGWNALERDRDDRSNQRVRELMDDALLWRPANSAQWVAWGIVQAAVPGLGPDNEPLPEEEARAAEREAAVDDFDYLCYAQDRALFFWGDVVRMGIVGAEELPEGLRARLKMVDR
ncbi:hypothetical protein L249_0824 [Ophiocordyceps polyrhachis-furcata BCC 54312]|uniref:Choline kinase N-terminal domain-containing protein n=1 Tax=Ophiocordyceps polyrhachis-furcata BCC 54312 TaxID=1330021 RepID=A0A367LFN3_9HYPO|nr:hypothetical protein L249_0824 [Ophiocordyceps polyrhachis-furcata BCC 54312]